MLLRQPLGPAAALQRVLQHMLRTLTADVLRVAAVYLEGGVYLDTDVISLQEIRHLSNFVVCEDPKNLNTFECSPCQAVFSFEAGHPRLKEWLINVALLLDNNTSSSNNSSSSSSSSSSKSSSSSSKTSSSSSWEGVRTLFLGPRRSVWSWEGRAGGSLKEMLAANEAAERLYKQQQQPSNSSNSNNSSSSSSSNNNNSVHEADKAFVRMLLLPWGTIGIKALQFMLQLWAAEPTPHLDARWMPPSLEASVLQQQQQQQLQQQEGVDGNPWSCLNRILGEAPPPSAAALAAHLEQSAAVQQQRQQQQQEEEEFEDEWEPSVGLLGRVGSVAAASFAAAAENVVSMLQRPSLLEQRGGPLMSFSATHLNTAANECKDSSSLTLYGPAGFYPFSYSESSLDRPGVSNDILWGVHAASAGIRYWNALIKNGNVYTLHLYGTMLHLYKGDFAAALQQSAAAAIGVIQRSYCTLLCGAARLLIFGGREYTREVSQELSELAKQYLRDSYNI